MTTRGGLSWERKAGDVGRSELAALAALFVVAMSAVFVLVAR